MHNFSNFEFRAAQACANLVDLVKSFLNIFFELDPNSNEYSLAKIGVDIAESEPLELRGKIQFNIHLPRAGRPAQAAVADAAPRREPREGRACLRAVH